MTSLYWPFVTESASFSVLLVQWEVGPQTAGETEIFGVEALVIIKAIFFTVASWGVYMFGCILYEKCFEKTDFIRLPLITLMVLYTDGEYGTHSKREFTETKVIVHNYTCTKCREVTFLCPEQYNSYIASVSYSASAPVPLPPASHWHEHLSPVNILYFSLWF